ncbi:MAG: exosortase/archaeosortase family protein [archaeon]|nr:exosortase/archaeosortase family protein [archaeon]
MARGTDAPEDLSWSEVGALGLRYAKFPVALLLVEAFYWFLTEPSDTLAPLQVVEAWLWHGITQLIWGSDAVSLSMHNGWLTRIDFHHPAFPGSFDSVGLYVSDECAGVHEMIFLSTLILITEDVPQRDRLRAVAVGCALVFVLNLARLVAFYPLALGGCLEAPNDVACLNGMWAFHRHVYEWGFLIVLIGLWLAWFTWVGGPRRVKDRSLAGSEAWRIVLRRDWAWRSTRPVWKQPLAGIAVAVVLAVLAALLVTNNAEAMAARDIVAECAFSDLVSDRCAQAQLDWNDAIDGAWSLASLGLLGVVVSAFVYERPLADGRWPSSLTDEEREALASEAKAAGDESE